MKKTLIAVAVASFSLSSFAQGNFLMGNVQSVFASDGTTKLSGSDFMAQVYVGSLGSSTDSLTAVGSPVAFLTGGGAGNFFGGTIATTFAGGASVTMVVKVWSAAAGASYEAAYNSGLTQYFAGSSNPFTHKLGDPTGSPATPASVLSGMSSFSLVSIAPVPEPTTIALAGIGGLALLGLRRKTA